MTTLSKQAEKQTAYGFGILFIGAIVASVFFVPEPTPFQYTVFRIVLALAAAGVAGMFSGFLEVRLATWIKAGGALAVFVLVFFYNPVGLVYPSPHTASYPQQSPVPTPAPVRLPSEDEARAAIGRALQSDHPDEAIALVSGLDPGMAKNEECERVYGYALKEKRWDKAVTVVDACWRGSDRQSRLSRISHEKLKL